MSPPSEEALRAVEIARRWNGTPYLHQASRKGGGADCLGLLRGVWRELYGSEPQIVPPYTADWSEAGRNEVLWDGLARHLKTANAPLALGDVLLFRMREGAVAKHLGLVTQVGAAPRFIHAYVGHGVVESPLSRPWQRRIVARFQFHEGVG
ncbi:peptidase [Thioclava atlantica]|uniref:NlpC/P60 family phage cell wall peptidase n=1 Tax=Thioclava atlantica TaxID=1317124 RepID=A0A085U033_9RHOB|nr:peptidase [Thioclava atlantica]KFE36330.1 NlpC/P60 family phage cell wall peptidase [Thioclava atlantica]